MLNVRRIRIVATLTNLFRLFAATVVELDQ